MSQPLKIFLTGVILLLLTAFAFNRFLDWHEHRPGIVFNDPVFTLFKATDCSVFTFIVLYGAIFGFVIIHFKKMNHLSQMVYAYVVVLLFRMLMLLILPFYADSDAIKLNDPFLNTFIYPDNYVWRDLFFSGHVATLVLLVLISDGKAEKWLFSIAVLIVSITVVIQKVHFSIDVIGAPFFALISYKIVSKFIIRR